MEIENTDTPWLYTSGGRGLSRFELPLLGKGDPPAKYTVKLHFASLDVDRSGPFDLRLQGEMVAQNVDVERDSQPKTATIKEYRDVSVDQALVVEMTARGDRLPTVAAIEVLRQD